MERVSGEPGHPGGNEFTPEQQTILSDLVRLPTHMSWELLKALREVETRVVAIEALLLEHGAINGDKLSATIDEIRKNTQAKLMIEKALDPKLQAFEDTMRRLLGQEG